MAKQASKAPVERGLQIDDASTYRITLNRKVERDGTWLLPRRTIKVSGAVLRELGDAVNVAEPIK